tara:strand:+ start:1555 stop:1899 length:345 start_codon:yes stop_codon:yes gene_type:complete
MVYKLNDIVVVKRVDSIRGRNNTAFGQETPEVGRRAAHPRLGKFLGLENIRNPYAGMGRAPKRLLMAKVELEPYCEWLIRNGVDPEVIPESYRNWDNTKNSMIVFTKVAYLGRA